MATTSPDRIASLDIIRGIAVMGIFSVNVVGMAMIENAYFYPPDYGFHSLGDKVMWAANFVLVDGKLRALFSMLFGASMLLVIERGVSAGKLAGQVHFARMLVLLAFGLAHFYLLWWGDILANYALVGMIAYFARRQKVAGLALLAVGVLTLHYAPTYFSAGQQIARYQAMAAPEASPEDHAEVAQLYRDLKTPPEEIAADKAAHATIAAHLRYTLQERPMEPFTSVFGYGVETLGLMLLGMIGYRTGFLTGAWSRRRYVQVAAVCIGASLAYFGIGAWRILRTDFEPLTFYAWNRIYSGPLHPVAAIGYAALIVLAVDPRGAMGRRLAAVGRAAFSNYLGSTLVGTLLFYGFGLGLYGEVSRGQAWLFVPPVWLLMLLWSKWWLDRYRYGPFEWAWRSLSRWQLQPMRKDRG